MRNTTRCPCFWSPGRIHKPGRVILSAITREHLNSPRPTPWAPRATTRRIRTPEAGQRPVPLPRVVVATFRHQSVWFAVAQRARVFEGDSLGARFFFSAYEEGKQWCSIPQVIYVRVANSSYGDTSFRFKVAWIFRPGCVACRRRDRVLSDCHLLAFFYWDSTGSATAQKQRAHCQHGESTSREV